MRHTPIPQPLFPLLALVLPALLPLAMAVARARVGIDFGALRSDPAALDLPTLLIHGDADPVVPVELSDALAAARPDVVTYLRVPGAAARRAAVGSSVSAASAAHAAASLMAAVASAAAAWGGVAWRGVE